AACSNDTSDPSDPTASNGETAVELPDSFIIAALMPLPDNATLTGVEWAIANVNAAGGILGEIPLELRTINTSGMAADAVVAKAEELAADPAVYAVIGPGSSGQMMDIAPIMINAQKPMVSFTATSGEVLRAFSGSPYVWRTKLTDLVQTQWLIQRSLAPRRPPAIGLITSLDDQGATFFNWFGFLATLAGYDEDEVHIEVYGESQSCEDATQAIMEGDAQWILAVPSGVNDIGCIIDSYRSSNPGDRSLVFADTGLEINIAIRNIGERALGVSGWTAAPAADSGFEAGWEAHFGNTMISNNAASEYDTVLLIAYGLEASGGRGGADLANAMNTVVEARGGEAVSWDAEGIEQALTAIRAGNIPDIEGATGPLEYLPGSRIDLAVGSLSRWVVQPEGLVYQTSVELTEDADSLLSGPGAMTFRTPNGGEAFEPTANVSSLKALIVSASSGWDNYRHQADALAHYQRLRTAGISDGDIVMVGADDIANASENPLPGVVRNVPGGDNLYEGVTYDYSNGINANDIDAILLGESGVATPEVLETDAGTNLFIFIVAHGGSSGIAMGADSAEEGVNSSGNRLTPEGLRDTLCTLRRENRVRRVFVAIEACNSGVFGDADFDGLESGCDDGEPLDGVVLLSAANTLENSLGTGYDRELLAWVGDEFSVALSNQLDQSDAPNLLDLYQDTYLSVQGSHVSMYNTETYGDLSSLTVGEFVKLP
ncbi:MAG: C13 family peptidase, partial [Myxococcota bacterium]